MNFKKSLKDVVVLVVICAVFATVLAAVNSVTAPIIAERLEGAANQAYEAVMPGATGFEDVDLSSYTLPATVVEAKREKSGMGYAIKLETKGYSTGMIIIVGVDSNGVVTGATCIASGETWGLEKTFGDKTVGKDINTIVDVEAGATSLTINGYRAAVKDAINAATVLGGGSADIRDDAKILADNLNAALPAGNGEFEKMLIVEIIEGIDKVYAAKNEAGYVLVVDGMFVGVGADGLAASVVDAKTNPVTEGIDEVKATAEAAAAIISATELTDVDVSAFAGIHSRIKSIQVTATGNYVFVVESEGHGIKGDEHAYPSGKPSVIKLSISKDGVVIDAQTLENNETDTWGGPQLNDGAYSSNFIGKTETEANGVDTVAESTNTTKGYKQAVLRCFEAYNIIVGGAN
jgi:electron transport complex protein RnfG